MNQGKLKVVKQKVARVNTDILGISELKWTGVGKFNAEDGYPNQQGSLKSVSVITVFYLHQGAPTPPYSRICKNTSAINSHFSKQAASVNTGSCGKEVRILCSSKSVSQ